MLESEAKLRWCPFVRTASVPVRRLHLAEEMLCIGSECMAWRAIPFETTVANRQLEKQPAGYCGLAGKP